MIKRDISTNTTTAGQRDQSWNCCLLFVMCKDLNLKKIGWVKSYHEMTFHTHKLEHSWFETYIHHRRKVREGLTWCIRHVPLKTWKSPSTVTKCKSRKIPSCRSCGASSVTSTTAFALNFTPRAKFFCPICSPTTRHHLDVKSANMEWICTSPVLKHKDMKWPLYLVLTMTSKTLWGFHQL